MMLNDDSPRDIQRTLNRLGAGLKKRWGQNFLIDRNMRNLIIEAVAPDRLEGEGPIWEIGPGLGAMTAMLLERSTRPVVAFELDHGFVRFLHERFVHNSRLTVVSGDVCDTFTDQLASAVPVAILGNLPYSSAGRIIGDLLGYERRRPERSDRRTNRRLVCRRMVFTTQRELTDRLVAPPNTPEYSAFSILCRVRAEIRRVRNLPGGCFYPPPRVNSSVVEIIPRRNEEQVRDIGLLQELLRGAFGARRKTLRNSLSATRFAEMLGRPRLEQLLAAAGATPEKRPQELTP